MYANVLPLKCFWPTQQFRPFWFSSLSRGHDGLEARFLEQAFNWAYHSDAVHLLPPLNFSSRDLHKILYTLGLAITFFRIIVKLPGTTKTAPNERMGKVRTTHSHVIVYADPKYVSTTIYCCITLLKLLSR